MRMMRYAAIALATLMGPIGCSDGSEAPSQSAEAEAEDLGLIGGKADGETTRQVELTLGPSASMPAIVSVPE